LHNLAPFQGLIFFLSITRGCAPLCGASPQAIAPLAPPALKKKKVNGIGRLAGSSCRGAKEVV